MVLSLALSPRLHAQANPDGSYTVPIYHYSQGGKNVLHIYASIDGGAFVPYLLDSGSPNFFAAYGSWWPGSPTTNTDGDYIKKFGSGTRYHYNAEPGATYTVTLGDMTGQTGLVSVDASIAQIAKAEIGGSESRYQDWQHEYDRGNTALSDGTFGNMGLGLEGNPDGGGLSTLLAQVPLQPDMDAGFIINTGGSTTADATLTIGLTKEMISLFQSSKAVVLTMNKDTGHTIAGPNGTTLDAYDEAQAGGTRVTVKKTNGDIVSVDLPTIFDTGGGNNAYIDSHGTILEGDYPVDQMTVTHGDETVFNFTDSSTPAGGGLYVTPEGGTEPRTNTGISVFLDYLVLFNISQGWMSLLPFSAVDSLPYLSNELTPASSDFTVDGSVTTAAAPVTVNSLDFDPSSTLTVSDSLTVTSGGFDVPTGSASLNGGTVNTPGDLTKTGSGALVTNTDLIVDGSADILQGGLVVNDSLTAADGVNVGPNAWLGGSGVIGADVTNSGALRPGNSPGTLTILGNFVQTASGELVLEVASTSVFDRLIVSGTATLGGTLSVTPWNGFDFAYGMRIPGFLQAGRVLGSFDDIAMPDGFRGRVLQDGGILTLLIAPESYTQVARTANQRNVARALDRFTTATSGDELTVSTALDLQTSAQYPASFDEISPAFYETLTDTTIEQYTTQGQMLAQRFSAVHSGSRGFQQMGLDLPVIEQGDGKEPKDFLAPTRDNNWGVWIQGNGIFANNYNVANLPGYHSESGGFLTGVDYSWSDSFSTGLYAGYQGSYSKYNDGGQTIMNGVRFGLYATWQPAPTGFYANAVLGGGASSYQVTRSIDFSTIDRNARSDVSGGEFTTLLNLGYDWQIGRFTLGPIASGQYTYVGLAPFTETGADSLDLRVGSQNANSLRTTLGGRIAYTWQPSSSLTIVPELRVGWQHEFLEYPTTISAALDGGSGPSFDYSTTSPARDSAWAGFGLNLAFSDRWTASVWYNSNFGRNDYVSQTISGGLGFKF